MMLGHTFIKWQAVLFCTKTIFRSLEAHLQCSWTCYLRNSYESIIYLCYSDRCNQYVSNARRKAAEDMQRSYSHKGYPYDNACIESFHALIKREWLDRFKITDFRHAYRLVFEYIEAFYNTVRIHSHCDYMSPDQHEKLYQKVTAV